MFVDYQNFADSMRRNFVCNLCDSLQCKTIHYFVIRSKGCNSWVIAVDIKTLMNNDHTTGLISIVKYATDGIQDPVHIT